jgi:replicative DNA helicase
MEENKRVLREATECIVVGSMLTNADDIPKVRSTVNEDDFNTEEWRELFNVICRLHDEGKPVNTMEAIEKLRGGELDTEGIQYVGTLMQRAKDHVNCKDAAIIYSRRLVSLMAEEQMALVYFEAAQRASAGDDVMQIAEDTQQRISAITARLVTDEVVVSLGCAMNELTDEVQRSLEADNVSGVSLGIEGVEGLVGVLRPSDTMVLAGLSGSGKTAMAMNAVGNLLESGKRVLVFTLEVERSQIASRLVAYFGGVCMSGLSDAQGLYECEKFDQDGYKRGRLKVHQLGDLCHIVDSVSTLPKIIEITKAYKEQYPDLALVVIDYIQLIALSDEPSTNKTADMSIISNSLKRLNQEIKTPILELAQFNREAAKSGQMPEMHQLKESSSIEQDATHILIIHRPKDESGHYGRNVELNLAKARNRAVGMVELSFDGETGTFAKSGPYEVEFDKSRLITGEVV